MERHFCLIVLLLALFLGCHNGFLAIFEASSSIPVEILPYKVCVFPEKDIKLLEKGIPFSTTDELSELLDDYIS